jgi:hypothetical protein
MEPQAERPAMPGYGQIPTESEIWAGIVPETETNPAQLRIGPRVTRPGSLGHTGRLWPSSVRRCPCSSSAWYW